MKHLIQLMWYIVLIHLSILKGISRLIPLLLVLLPLELSISVNSGITGQCVKQGPQLRYNHPTSSTFTIASVEKAALKILKVQTGVLKWKVKQTTRKGQTSHGKKNLDGKFLNGYSTIIFPDRRWQRYRGDGQFRIFRKIGNSR